MDHGALEAWQAAYRYPQLRQSVRIPPTLDLSRQAACQCISVAIASWCSDFTTCSGCMIRNRCLGFHRVTMGTVDHKVGRSAHHAHQRESALLSIFPWQSCLETPVRASYGSYGTNRTAFGNPRQTTVLATGRWWRHNTLRLPTLSVGPSVQMRQRRTYVETTPWLPRHAWLYMSHAHVTRLGCERIARQFNEL